jgi:hypothetical protein
LIIREELGRRWADDFEDFDHHAARLVDADKAALAPGVIAQGIDDLQARLLEPGDSLVASDTTNARSTLDGRSWNSSGMLSWSRRTKSSMYSGRSKWTKLTNQLS